tara:strand:+ start:441 stop:563 length:123 start_codon:yes stop_codon:yes gene_type:complete
VRTDEDIKDIIKIVGFVSLFFIAFMLLACDGGWSIAGYEL